MGPWTDLEEGIKTLNREKIQLNRDHARLCSDLLSRTWYLFKEQMIQDSKQFDVLFRNEQYAGSSFQNLRIIRKDEFDLQIVLRLPSSAQIEMSDDNFATIRLPPQADREEPDIMRALQVMLDRDRFLSPSLARNWFYKVMNDALTTLTTHNNKQNVIATVGELKRSGPAATLYIKSAKDEDVAISVDYVLAFEFPMHRVPHHLRNQQIVTAVKSWDTDVIRVVAKNRSDDSRTWTIQFWSLEKRILKDNGNMKQALRLIKWLRDSEGDGPSLISGSVRHSAWKALSSYMIRTHFLWELFERPKDFWRRSTAEILVETMGSLAEKLENCSLPDYFMPKYDSCKRSGVNPQVWSGMGRCLQRIRSRLITDPEKALQDDFRL